jgi:hypothetical protein
MEVQTNADHLRGLRFWVPLLLFVAALGTSYYFLQDGDGPSVINGTEAATLDPVLDRLITRLETNGFICGDLRSRGATEVLCSINSVGATTKISTFGTPAALKSWVRVQERAAARSFSQDNIVRYLVTGQRWAIAGTWSPDGGYGDSGNPDAQTAQDLNVFLQGCLELLPREKGSCSVP